MRVLGLVPARGGSKGVPRKNLVSFLGRSLVARAIDCGRDARSVTDVVVSTDDDEIADAAREAGGEVPFLRPAPLADDRAPTLGVVQHALDALADAGRTYDAVCLLQPTNPLRLPEDVDAAADLLRRTDATAVVTVEAVPHAFHPHWAFLEDASGHLVPAVPGRLAPRRQALPEAWVREGGVYLTRVEVIQAEDSLFGERVHPLRIPAARCGNIDTPEDLERLRQMALDLGWSEDT